jgi:hypothetical protein
LPEFGVRIDFKPTDFTQVNHAVNRVLVRRALRLLDPQPGERIADLFCGLGNFTLPIARSGAEVLGIEGSPALVRRGRKARTANGLAEHARVRVANLFECTSGSLAALGQFDKMLIDPPREGRSNWSRRWARRPAADRLRLLQSGHAGAGCGGAGCGQGLYASCRRHRQHVPAHRPRRVDRGFRALSG